MHIQSIPFPHSSQHGGLIVQYWTCHSNSSKPWMLLLKLCHCSPLPPQIQSLPSPPCRVSDQSFPLFTAVLSSWGAWHFPSHLHPLGLLFRRLLSQHALQNSHHSLWFQPSTLASNATFVSVPSYVPRSLSSLVSLITSIIIWYAMWQLISTPSFPVERKLHIWFVFACQLLDSWGPVRIHKISWCSVGIGERHDMHICAWGETSMPPCPEVLVVVFLQERMQAHWKAMWKNRDTHLVLTVGQSSMTPAAPLWSPTLCCSHRHNQCPGELWAFETSRVSLWAHCSASQSVTV